MPSTQLHVQILKSLVIILIIAFANQINFNDFRACGAAVGLDEVVEAIPVLRPVESPEVLREILEEVGGKPLQLPCQLFDPPIPGGAGLAEDPASTIFIVALQCVSRFIGF